MTSTRADMPLAATGGNPPEPFAQGFTALLEVAAAQAQQRERDHQLPHNVVKGLQALGFGARRLPGTEGAPQISLVTLFGQLIDLAAADSNIAHLYRGHLAFVETLLFNNDTAEQERWARRIRAGGFIGNAQSEVNGTSDISSTLSLRDGRPVLNGRKYYTTGSLYADWIHVSALDAGERVGATIDARHPGVRVTDDWDGFGQRLTGSGSAVFSDVPVDPRDVHRLVPDDQRFAYVTGIFQLCLLATVAGVAWAALEDTVAFVRPRTRLFGFAGEYPPRHDPLVQATVGRLSSVAHTARAIVLDNAAELDAALEARLAGDDPGEQFLHAQLGVYRAQQVLLPLVLEATTELFEVGGASAVGAAGGLDRHWRNVRTVASHNPAAQRARQLGDFHLNGTTPSWRRAPNSPETTGAGA